MLQLHAQTEARFSAAFAAMPRVTSAAKAFVARHAAQLDAALRPERDFLISYFGLATLTKSYLIRDESASRVLERPCQMWMRVAVGVAAEAGVEEVLQAYELMSKLVYTHATPTLFNAATTNAQLSSCFLLQMKSDSIRGIFETLQNTALISKSAGGVGLSVSNIRATGSPIRGTGGTSNGLRPMLRCFNETARYVDQGGGKRKGSFAIYLEPWHADVFEFLDLRKNTGTEHERTRDLFTALWVPDLLMRRVEADAEWSLFCPSRAPGLTETHSAAFDELYERYEAQGLATRTVKARALFGAILTSQMETGTPYLCYKDAANAKSNQQHLGCIQCSNLCTEIMQYTSADEIAVCNLASVALPKFVVEDEEGAKAFDYDALAAVTRVAVRNLDRVIDRNAYPVPEAERSNMRHRPVGLGVQGLADTLVDLGLAFDSEAGVAASERIFAEMYFAALSESCRLAQRLGPHASFAGSPASRGALQFDMWARTDYVHGAYGGRERWDALRRDIEQHGLRNSLLVAPMPTASTSQILGNTESFEPINSNLYQRTTLAGSFTVMNARLVAQLERHGLWNEETRNRLIRDRGSAENLGLPPSVAQLFRTAWQMSQRWLIDHAAARGMFCCQSQSLNLYVAAPTAAKLASMHVYAWKKGLKTGLYYLRTKAAVDTIQFSLPTERAAAAAPTAAKAAAAPTGDDDEADGCLSCGS